MSEFRISNFEIRNQKGATLFEALVVLSIFLIVLFAVYSVYDTSQVIYTRGEQQASIQDAARAAMERVVADIRMVGFGVPTATDPAPIPAITSATPTSFSFVANMANVTTTLTSAAPSGSSTLAVSSTAGFRVNDQIYIADTGKYRAATVTAIGPTSLTISPTLNVGFGPKSTVSRQPVSVTYSYSTGTLYRDPGDGTGSKPLVTGLTGLTFTYYDQNNTLVTVPGGPLQTIRRIVVAFTIKVPIPGQAPQPYALESDIRIRNLP